VASDAFLFRLLPDQPDPVPERPEVSLVLAVGTDLDADLARLAEAGQTYAEADLEVVLIDRGDGLADLAALALSGAPVRVVRGDGSVDDRDLASRVASGRSVVVLD